MLFRSKQKLKSWVRGFPTYFRGLSGTPEFQLRVSDSNSPAPNLKYLYQSTVTARPVAHLFLKFKIPLFYIRSMAHLTSDLSVTQTTGDEVGLLPDISRSLDEFREIITVLIIVVVAHSHSTTLQTRLYDLSDHYNALDSSQSSNTLALNALAIMLVQNAEVVTVTVE